MKRQTPTNRDSAHFHAPEGGTGCCQPADSVGRAGCPQPAGRRRGEDTAPYQNENIEDTAPSQGEGIEEPASGQGKRSDGARGIVPAEDLHLVLFRSRTDRPGRQGAHQEIRAPTQASGIDATMVAAGFNPRGVVRVVVGRRHATFDPRERTIAFNRLSAAAGAGLAASRGLNPAATVSVRSLVGREVGRAVLSPPGGGAVGTARPTVVEGSSNAPVQERGIYSAALGSSGLGPRGSSSRNSRFDVRNSLAFSLIEMIGVLAVIAILAAVLVPAWLQQSDKVAGDQESAVLKSLGDALQQSIMRQRYIPSDADWAQAVATELGVDPAGVTTGQRRQPRLFLIDPALSIAGSGLPYTQTSAGSPSVPSSPRVIILSSVGAALPAGMTSGVAAASDFTNIWNSADGTVPAAPSFAGWAGTGDDLKVQRVNLSALFVRLGLSWAAPSHVGPRYAIDANNWASAIVVSNASADWPGYFIQNSILYLYNYNGTLDSQQILIRDNSFTYDQDNWRGSLGGEFFLAGLDVASTVDRYLAAYPNARAANGTNQQAIVVQSMIAFMDRYDAWANAGFPYNAGTAPTYTDVVNAQVAMVTAVQGQYQATGNNPTETPCQ